LGVFKKNCVDVKLNGDTISRPNTIQASRLSEKNKMKLNKNKNLFGEISVEDKIIPAMP